MSKSTEIIIADTIYRFVLDQCGGQGYILTATPVESDLEPTSYAGDRQAIVNGFIDAVGWEDYVETRLIEGTES